MKTTVTLLLCSVATMLSAQLTITSDWISLSNLISVFGAEATNVTFPGNPGENQHWDFSHAIPEIP